MAAGEIDLPPDFCFEALLRHLKAGCLSVRSRPKLASIRLMPGLAPWRQISGLCTDLNSFGDPIGHGLWGRPELDSFPVDLGWVAHPEKLTTGNLERVPSAVGNTFEDGEI
jgi:hypothetical protein